MGGWRVALIAILMLAGLAPAALPGSAQDTGDVPMFRGNPARTGEMPGPGPEGEISVLWQWSGDEGDWVESSPAVVNGIVYVGVGHTTESVATNTPDTYSGYVIALDATERMELWRFATGSIVRSSPAVIDGVVYVGSDDDNVYAIDAATGSERWRFATGSYVRSSPAVVDGVAYVGSWDGNVYALANPATLENNNAYQQYWTDTAFNLGWLAESSSDVPRGLTIGAGGRSADDPRLPWNAAAGRTWAVTLGRGGSGEAAVSALAYDDAAAAASEAQVALDGLTRQGWTTAETDRVVDRDTCLTYRDASGVQAVCYAVRGRLVIVGVSALPVDNVDAVLMNAVDLVRLGVAATQDLTLPE